MAFWAAIQSDISESFVVGSVSVCQHNTWKLCMVHRATALCKSSPLLVEVILH